MTDMTEEFLSEGERIERKLPKKAYLTNRRVIYYKSGYFSEGLVELDYASIESVNFRSGRSLPLFLIGLLGLIIGFVILAQTNGEQPLGLLFLLAGLAAFVIGFMNKKRHLIFNLKGRNEAFFVPGTVGDARVARELIETYRETHRPEKRPAAPGPAGEPVESAPAPVSAGTEAATTSFGEAPRARPFEDQPAPKPFEEPRKTPFPPATEAGSDEVKGFSDRGFQRAALDTGRGGPFAAVPKRFSKGTRGVARNVERRTVRSGGFEEEECLGFRLEVVDSQGDVADVIPVEIRAEHLTGSLQEGDSLVLLGRRDRRGLIKPKSLYNATTRSEVKFNSGGFFDEVLKLVLGLIWMAAALGLFGGIVMIFVEPEIGIPLAAGSGLIMIIYAYIHKKRRWKTG